MKSIFNALYIMPLVILFFSGCEQRYKENIPIDINQINDTIANKFKSKQKDPKIELKVYENDTFNFLEDKNFGNGDDDLFTADNFEIFKCQNGDFENVTNVLNDYNLTTALKGKFVKKDTFVLVIDFKGLIKKDSAIDTNVIIEKISFFNGDRRSIDSWEKNGAVREVEVFTNRLFLGRIELKNTFKQQTIFIGPIVNTRGNKDSICLIINSIYGGQRKNTYSISEIKLEGQRNY